MKAKEVVYIPYKSLVYMTKERFSFLEKVGQPMHRLCNCLREELSEKFSPDEDEGEFMSDQLGCFTLGCEECILHRGLQSAVEVEEVEVFYSPEEV